MTGDRQVGAIGHFISDDTDEWGTPPSFVRPLAEAMGGFDLDPSSGAEQSPIAEETYTEDGLRRPWHGDVWLNPPYSEVSDWLAKAVGELRSGNVETVLALVKGDTSTQWYHQYGLEADAIAFIEGRLHFDGDAEKGHSAPFASHVLVYGDVPDAALESLAHQGAVVPTPSGGSDQTALLAGGFDE